MIEAEELILHHIAIPSYAVNWRPIVEWKLLHSNNNPVEKDYQLRRLINNKIYKYYGMIFTEEYIKIIIQCDKIFRMYNITPSIMYHGKAIITDELGEHAFDKLCDLEKGNLKKSMILRENVIEKYIYNLLKRKEKIAFLNYKSSFTKNY
ncbi:hypothetical protein Goe21_00520 [Bacillus phage vB_BsuM-Goe21]|nr:hypothetical protein Goe21_00520 [Bacillus phage vB_BsuM-Goe21]